MLYVGDEPIDGAREAIGALRDHGLGLRFVTNTTERSRAQTVDKLGRLGFDVEPGEVVTPAALARQHCLDAGHRPTVFALFVAIFFIAANSLPASSVFPCRMSRVTIMYRAVSRSGFTSRALR